MNLRKQFDRKGRRKWSDRSDGCKESTGGAETGRGGKLVRRRRRQLKTSANSWQSSVYGEILIPKFLTRISENLHQELFCCWESFCLKLEFMLVSWYGGQKLSKSQAMWVDWPYDEYLNMTALILLLTQHSAWDVNSFLLVIELFKGIVQHFGT